MTDLLATGLAVGCVDKASLFSIGCLTMLGDRQARRPAGSAVRSVRCWPGVSLAAGEARAMIVRGRDAWAGGYVVTTGTGKRRGPATLLSLLYFSDQKFRNHP
jgi:hypothetical protein